MTTRRTVLDYPRNEAGLVDEFIGTAYDTVSVVAENLPFLQGLETEIPVMGTEAVQTALDTLLPPIKQDLQASVTKAEDIVGILISAQTTDPLTRDNGEPLQLGDKYLNTAIDREKIYTSSGWIVNNVDGQALANQTNPQEGAAIVGWDNQNLAEQLKLNKILNTYEDLREYAGLATRVVLQHSGIAGVFALDTADLVTPDDGISVIVGVGNRRWKRQFNGTVDSKWSGAVPSEDSSSAMQKTIDCAVRKNRRSIIVDDELQIPAALVDRSQVFFRGSGKVSGAGAYRKDVFSWETQSGKQVINDLDPSKHLQVFSVARQPVVVLVGSSTGAWSPNTVDTSATVIRLLRDRISRANPEKNVTVHNRCIGGQSYLQLDGVPTSFPNWYTDHAKPWLDYIKDLGPDVVYILMGSGDSSAMEYTRIKSVTDKIKAFTKVPNIVYITQPSVNPDPHPNYASFGTKDALEGRDYAAGMVRSFALFNKYGLIDANRMGGIVLDGRDLCDTISKRVITAQATTGGEFTSPYSGHDFALRVELPLDAAGIDSYFKDAANPVFFRVGAGTSDTRGGDIVFIRKNAAGNFRFECFTKGGGNYASIDTAIPFPTAAFSLDISKANNMVFVSVADSEDTTFMMFPIIAYGGEFAPQIGCRNGGGPISLLTFLNIGEPRQYLPALTSDEAWGSKSADATTQYPYGGNGVNHFSSLGTSYIYGPLLTREVLTAARTGDGVYTPVVGDTTNAATYVPGVAMWSRVGDVVTVSGAISISPQASGTVQVDLSLPVPTNLVSPADLAGTCGAGMVASMNGSVWGNDALDRARVQLTTTVVSAQNIRYTYSYRIR